MTILIFIFVHYIAGIQGFGWTHFWAATFNYLWIWEVTLLHEKESFWSWEREGVTFCICLHICSLDWSFLYPTWEMCNNILQLLVDNQSVDLQEQIQEIRVNPQSWEMSCTVWILHFIHNSFTCKIPFCVNFFNCCRNFQNNKIWKIWIY